MWEAEAMVSVGTRFSINERELGVIWWISKEGIRLNKGLKAWLGTNPVGFILGWKKAGVCRQRDSPASRSEWNAERTSQVAQDEAGVAVVRQVGERTPDPELLFPCGGLWCFVVLSSTKTGRAEQSHWHSTAGPGGGMKPASLLGNGDVTGLPW